MEITRRHVVQIFVAIVMAFMLFYITTTTQLLSVSQECIPVPCTPVNCLPVVIPVGHQIPVGQIPFGQIPVGQPVQIPVGQIPVAPPPVKPCPVPSPFLKEGNCKVEEAAPGGIKVALLVTDCRKIDELSSAVTSFLLNTPPEWPLIMYIPLGDSLYRTWWDSKSWYGVARRQNRNLIYKQFPNDCIGQSQNCVNLNATFWKEIEEFAQYVIFFQADSATCSRPDKAIQNFLHYDYVGAPWEGPRSFINWTIQVGNGGTSVRNTSFMHYCLTSGWLPPQGPEDYYFSTCAQLFGRLPQPEIARMLSLRSPWNETTVAMCPESSHLFWAVPDVHICPK